jgi:hypothetical protein
MKTQILIIILFLAFLLNACVIKSLNPFYTEKDVVYKKELVGSWIDNDSSKWTIGQYTFSKGWNQGDSLDNSYRIQYMGNEGNKAIFNAHIFKLNNEYYLDFFPLISDFFKNDEVITSHLLPTHSVAKLEIRNNSNVTIRWFNEDWLKNLFNENRIKIAHQIVKTQDDNLGDFYVLTASTDELQKFILKFGNEPRAFDNPGGTVYKDGRKPLVFNLKKTKGDVYSE